LDRDISLVMPIFAGVGANQRGPKSGHDNLADLDTLYNNP
jgi:hypothetical protein